MIGDSQMPSCLTTLCGVGPTFVHSTVVPAGIVMFGGSKAKSTIWTATRSDAASGGSGAGVAADVVSSVGAEVAVGACVAVGSLVAVGGTVGVVVSPAADVSPAAPPPQAARLTLIGTSSRPNTPRRVRRRFSNPLDIGSFLFGRAHRTVRPPRAHLPHYRVAWRRSRTPPP